MKSKIITLLLVLGCCDLGFSQTCPGSDGNTAMAGTVSISGRENCTNGLAVSPFTVTDTGGDVNAIYFAVDGPTGNILTMFDSSSGTEYSLNLTPNGTEVCVQSASFNQADLDNFILALNQWCGDNPVICNLIPGNVLPLPVGSSLVDIFFFISILGTNVDVVTFEALINNGMAQTDHDLGVVLGFPPNLMVLDVPSICYDISEPVCVTPICACPTSIFLTGDIPSSIYRAGYNITSNGTISANRNVQFEAGRCILLENDFTVEANVNFYIEIGCDPSQ